MYFGDLMIYFAHGNAVHFLPTHKQPPSCCTREYYTSGSRSPSETMWKILPPLPPFPKAPNVHDMIRPTHRGPVGTGGGEHGGAGEVITSISSSKWSRSLLIRDSVPERASCRGSKPPLRGPTGGGAASVRQWRNLKKTGPVGRSVSP